jgi:hypothetical protein
MSKCKKYHAKVLISSGTEKNLKDFYLMYMRIQLGIVMYGLTDFTLKLIQSMLAGKNSKRQSKIIYRI